MAKTTNNQTTNNDVEAAKVVGVEAQLIAKYGDKIVPGSVRRAPEGSKYGRKMLVDIKTRGLDGEYDGNTRTVATSDVFQVHHTEEVKAELKKQRMAEKRAAKRAEREDAKADEPSKPKRRTRKANNKAESKNIDAAAALGVE